MEHILNSFNNDGFYDSCISFFKKLNIPVSKITSHPIAINDLFQIPKPSFLKVKEIYVVGMVNDDSFRSNIESIDYKHKKSYEGILIFGVELNIDNPTRSQLSEISRAFNREYHYTPVIIIFKYGNKLSFSNTQRQEYKIAKEGEKAGKVSILRDVDIDNPHRGHIDILESMKKTSKVNSYETLYQHWQEVFDVSILNKAFYKELSDWYFWTLKENNVSFPNAPKGLEENALTMRHEHNAKNVIRLLTRLLFVWFMKEKGLVPEELFEEDYIKNNLLKEFNPKKAEGLFANSDPKSKYYKAVLQNLFFATLNQEMGKRAFRNEKQHRNITNLMRYENYFSNPQEFIDLVESVVPFMNGGLFECLDKPHPTLKGSQGGDVIIYEDGFSDRPDNELVVPDYIFFGLEEHVDLSEAYGSKSKAYKNIKVKGLIDILNSYKFTVAENTPIDEDVALDPELLGKVFENLLASYNPETKTSARKQTGSFYTPREIVSYMVDESLIAYLQTKLENYEDKNELDEKLHRLLAYDDVQPFEDKKVIIEIIHAIDSVKILDPAVGSGAFPMGTLQKMVHLLHKLDPNNEYWQDLQVEKAKKETDEVFKTEDKKQREERLLEINNTFDITINHPDYARKLYIIENSIFGVDIQPIAIQISKLRFFISLVVEQNVNNDKLNFGIRPLPNLESKFVAANTLIGIEKEEANLFDKKEIKKLEEDLKKIRHKLFNARTPKTKRNLRAKDQELREEIAIKLIENGLANNTAKQLASWDPYDQNSSSSFFDMEWMFGIENGFDIVIGNPPYVGEKGNKSTFEILKNSNLGKRFYQGKMDLFYFFFHLSLDVAKEKGIITLITTNYYITADGARNLRTDFKDRATIQKLINFNELKIFISALGQHNLITILEKGKSNKNGKTISTNNTGVVDIDLLNSILNGVDPNTLYYEMEQSKLYDGENNYMRLSGIGNLDNPIENVLSKISTNNVFLEENCYIHQGLKTNADKVTDKHLEKYSSLKQNNVEKGEGIFILQKDDPLLKVLNTEEQKFIKPMFKNSDIYKYHTKEEADLVIIFITKNHYINSNTHPNLTKHFNRYRDVLQNRAEIEPKGRIPLYSLTRPRKDYMYVDNKIVASFKSKSNIFAYNNCDWYASGDVYFITPKENSTIELKYILALLNSKLYFQWLYNRGKRKGEMLELYQKPLSEIPIKAIPRQDQQSFINIVDQIIEHKARGEDTDTLETQLDKMIYELYGLSDDEIKIVEAQ